VRRRSGDAPEQAALSANVRRWSTLFYRYSRFFLLPVPYLLKTALIQINYTPFFNAKSRLPRCQRHYQQGQKLDYWQTRLMASLGPFFTIKGGKAPPFIVHFI
jgi:hypothetical protein